jgi:hypothetical protein
VPLVGLCAVLKNSVQLENRASPVFEKFKKKIMKFRKFWSKCTDNDRGTVKTGRTEMRPVSPINQPDFSKNRCGDFRVNFVRNEQILPKIGKWNEKIVKNNDIT